MCFGLRGSRLKVLVVSPQVGPDVILSEVGGPLDRAKRGGIQPLRLHLVEPPAQLLFVLVGEIAQCLLDSMGKSDVEWTCQVSDDKAEVMMMRLLHAEHPPLNRHPSFLLEMIDGKVGEQFGDEVVVLQTGGEVEVNLKTAVQGIAIR